MFDELDKILISYKEQDLDKRLTNLRQEIMKTTLLKDAPESREELTNIIADVAEHGDKAVAKYTKEFDGIELTPEQFCISADDLKKAHSDIDKNLLSAIRQSIENVRKYQKEIFIGDKNTHPGIRYTPINRVGICVPGASAPLPSTVIMTAVPARVAGVEEIVVVSPPRHKGTIHPVILAVCYELRIREVYRIGGAHAITALVCGTKTIEKVDKIVGPGNQWVQTAKKEAFGLVGIDSLAGPSEVLIIANEEANPAWVAADMLSQAEHAPGIAVVFTDSQGFGEEVLEELKKQIGGLNRARETNDCLTKLGGIFVFKNMEDIIRNANDFAPEHLEIQCGERSREIEKEIKNAGAIFIGDYSPVAVGDYWAGPSHTLPTGTSARFFSALSANDFIKSTSIIEYSKEKLAESAEDIIRLAEAEGLDAHAKSVKIRQNVIARSPD